MTDAPGAIVPRQSLLPVDSVPAERAIEGADAAIGDLPAASIIAARDVAACPAVYLPDLAWERSVDVWDPSWPDEVKRAVIEAAPEVHRHKGTRYAVTTALAALGVDTDVTEWWQTTPKGAPYTFRVTAYARARLYNGPLLDARLIRVVFASILHAKPESRAFGLDVAANYQATLGLAAIATAATRVGTSARPKPATDFGATLGLAAVATAATRVAAAMVAVLPPP